jgi:hypothetical protein
MKTNILIYVLSLIILIVSIVLVVEFPDSNRTLTIAGGITLLGFALNIVSFVTKK